jgi:adenine-specific DNA methylase
MVDTLPVEMLNPMQYDRRLIEDSLPLEAISAQSAREKSIRHGHISTLHIWWARRPLAAMRAAIFASLIPAPKDEQEREYLHRLIGGTFNPQTKSWEGGIVDWDSVKNGNSAVIEEAKALIRKYYPDAPPKVLDPFMGGGSTGLEALRLGAEAHGVELNPVAYLIQLCTLIYPQKYGQPKTVYVLPEPELEQTEIPGMEDQRPRQMDMDLSGAEPAVVQNPLAADVRKWGMCQHRCRVSTKQRDQMSPKRQTACPPSVGATQ